MEDCQMAVALSQNLAARIGAERFAMWFGPETRLSVAARCLTVQAASAFVRDLVRKHFAEDIGACWKEITSSSAAIEFVVDPSLVNPSRQAAGPSLVERARAAIIPKPPADSVAEGVVPDGHCDDAGRSRGSASLAAFVGGPSNECALRAAELTARGLQQASPVVLCGPTGVGKTHLLRAIQRESRRHQPRAAAVYMSAEQFTTNFVDAIRGTGLPSFRQKCRGANLLLIDDLQFFAGKQRTLEELQHTIDTLLADGRQLVLASDRDLVELRALGSEMISRLSGGLVCKIEPPEYATRLKITRALSLEIGLTLDAEVLQAIAAQVSAGARELRGALYRLQAMSHAFERPITQELAEKALADLVRQSTPAVRLGDVQKAVCNMFGVEPAELRSERKGRSLSEPRMLAMWLARKYTRAAWSEIGQFFGRRSHSTVISAHRRVERLISTQAKIGMNDRTCSVEDAIRRLEAALRTA